MATPMSARSSLRKFPAALRFAGAAFLGRRVGRSAPAASHKSAASGDPGGPVKKPALLLTASYRPKELAAAVKGLSSTNGGLPSVPLLARVGYYVTPADGGFPHFVAVNDLTASELQTSKPSWRARTPMSTCSRTAGPRATRIGSTTMPRANTRSSNGGRPSRKTTKKGPRTRLT